MEFVSSDYTNPATDHWWEFNPDHWCAECNTNLRDSHGTIRECPVCEDGAA